MFKEKFNCGLIFGTKFFIPALLFFTSCSNEPAHWDDSPPKQNTKITPTESNPNSNYSSSIPSPVFNYPSDSQNGGKLFKAYCAACHKFSTKLSGPALQGVRQRVPNQSPLYIRAVFMKPDSLLKIKDPYYVNKLKVDYPGPSSHGFGFLTEQEANDITAFIISTSYGCP